MFDEFKFAIQCGGSAKKIQTNAQVLSLREELQQQLKSNPSGNLHSRASDSKALFDGKQPTQREKDSRPPKLNKTDSVSYMSSSNPGLQESLQVEAHHVLIPHGSSNQNLHQQQPLHQKHHHHHSKHSSHYSSGKAQKKKPRHHASGYNNNNNNNSSHQDESDYIVMRPMISSKSNILNNYQRAHSSEQRAGSTHNIPINIDQEIYFDQSLNQQQEQQINFDRYLSKSQILMKQNSNSSNNNLSRSNNRYV